MKLLFATSSIFYPDSSGGAERSLVALFEGLQRRGWRVELLCGRSVRSPRTWAVAARGLGALKLPSPLVRDDIRGLPCWRGLVRSGSAAWMQWLDERLEAFGPDVVLGYTTPACPMLRRAAQGGYPSFFIARSLANLFGPGRYLPDDVHLLANSPFTAAVAGEAFGRPVEVVLPVVDFAAYVAPERAPRYITFVNPMPEKGVEIALAVARAMPEARFLFVSGRWADRTYSARGRPDLANLEVWEHRDDMRPVYAATDILLVPSQWLETFGRVVVEAQANGIPVVAADVGGLPFTVGEGGLLVRPKADVAAYVEALGRLRADGNLYAQVSAKALANSRRAEFDPEAQIDRFVSIVERVRASPREPAPPPASAATGDHGPRDQTDATTGVPGGRGLVAAAIVIAVLQGAFLILTCHTLPTRVAAGALTSAIVFVAWPALRRCTVGRRNLLAVLLALQLAGLGFHWPNVAAPLRFRSLLFALGLAYAAVAVAAALRAARIARFAEALLLCASVSVGIVAADAFVSRAGIGKRQAGALWSGGTQPHPTIGAVFAPHSVAITYYPDNPRGYFNVSDPRDRPWILETRNGAAARLEASPGRPGVVRIEVDRAPRPMLWDVQLIRGGLSVGRGKRYELNFRGRAPEPRRFVFAVSQAHEPWQPLGLYREAELGPAWTAFHAQFTADAGDDQARLNFDVGGGAQAAELADVSLRGLDDAPAELPGADYTVTFRFNDRGCRGRDYDVPRPPGVFRILMLGDSYVQGVGVHERDTVSARLEALLNARAKGSPPYEVVNCGVTGYATREERLFYELIGAAYEPQLVLLGMVFNDDRSWLDDVNLGYYRRPTRLEELFPLWRAVQAWRYRRPPPDFSASIKELKKLDEASGQHGARLVAFLFRNHKTEEWRALADQLAAGLQGGDIPVLDVGPALLRDHTERELVVHATDGHPNEIGHRLAAEDLLRFLDHEHLLDAPRRPSLRVHETRGVDASEAVR